MRLSGACFEHWDRPQSPDPQPGPAAEPPQDGQIDPGLRQLLLDLSTEVGKASRSAGIRAKTGGRWLADMLLEAAPHLPMRDVTTLSHHYHGLEGEALADAMVRNAARSTMAVGAAGGALAAVSWAAPIALITIPAQIVVETLAVAAIEVKLVAELHEVYGLGITGTVSQRGTAYTVAWAARRGVSPFDPTSVTTAFGRAARERIQRRLVARTGRAMGMATPFLVGAAYGAWLNNRTLERLAESVRNDLRRRRPLHGGVSGGVMRHALRVVDVRQQRQHRAGGES